MSGQSGRGHFVDFLDMSTLSTFNYVINNIEYKWVDNLAAATLSTFNYVINNIDLNI
jgi:hypothetical protein